MTEILLLDAIIERLKKRFYGYTLLNKSGILQEIKIFGQYMPQPEGITITTKEKSGVKNYDLSDYEKNFPSLVVRMGECVDEENRSLCAVKIIFGVYDADSECQGFRDVLNLQEMTRELFLHERILAQRYILRLPLKSRLLDVESWPIYFGEQDLNFEMAQPLPREYVYEGRIKRHERNILRPEYSDTRD